MEEKFGPYRKFPQTLLMTTHIYQMRSDCGLKREVMVVSVKVVCKLSSTAGCDKLMMRAPREMIMMIRVCRRINRMNLISGQSVPIPRHSQTRAKNTGLVTLETNY